MKFCWYLSRALPDTMSGMGVRQIFKIRPVLKPDIFLSARQIYSLIVLITLWISCVSPMHRKNINHMKHYVVMKEVHRLAPALASLLRRRKNRNFCTQWVQAVQCTAALFCTYYSGPVCAIPYFSTRFIQNYVKACFAMFETRALSDITLSGSLVNFQNPDCPETGHFLTTAR